MEIYTNSELEVTWMDVEAGWTPLMADCTVHWHHDLWFLFVFEAEEDVGDFPNLSFYPCKMEKTMFLWLMV